MKSQNRPPAPAPAARKPEDSASAAAHSAVIRRHLAVGWWTLLLFLSAGLFLEALHGFKVGAYLNVSNEIRRLMWTLSHAHGTLLGLVNIAFAFTLGSVPRWQAKARDIASVSLLSATFLMPVGFFLGGLFKYSGDPGLGILLVPLGGLLLFSSVLMTALALKGQTEANQ